MKTIKYANKYGSLELELVSPYMPVSSVYSKNVDESLFMFVDDAERVALITGNKSIQLSVTWKAGYMFLIHHESACKGAICKVKRLEFNPGIDARKELAKSNSYAYL